MIFNQQQQQQPVITGTQPSQAVCPLECEDCRRHVTSGEPSKKQQQQLRRSGPKSEGRLQRAPVIRCKPSKRSNEASSPVNSAARATGSQDQEQKPPGDRTQPPPTLAAATGQLNNNYQDSDEDSEEFTFDYGPVLVRILNEKKLVSYILSLHCCPPPRVVEILPLPPI